MEVMAPAGPCQGARVDLNAPVYLKPCIFLTCSVRKGSHGFFSTKNVFTLQAVHGLKTLMIS